MPQYPIVGAFYRPPAKTVLECLPLGTRLRLEAEPENQYDENAIKVLLDPKDLPQEGSHAQALEDLLPTQGFELGELREVEEIHLGYLPREVALTIRQGGFLDLWGGEEGKPDTIPRKTQEGELRLMLDGKPAIKWESGE